jgi:hypothetical protein
VGVDSFSFYGIKNIVGGERNRNFPLILFIEDEKIIISTTG